MLYCCLQEAAALSRIMDAEEVRSSDPPDVARFRRALAADRHSPALDEAPADPRSMPSEPVLDVDAESV